MCEPTTIGGLVLAGLGGLYQGQTQANYVDAQNKANQQAYQASRNARLAEQTRQKGFENEAAAGWQSTLDALTPDQRKLQEEQAAKNFMNQYDTSASDQVSGQMLSGQESAAPEVKNAINEQIASAAKATRERVAALAALSGGGSVDVSRGLVLGNNSNFLGTLNGLRRGSLGVSSQEQSIQPNMVTPGNGALGSILSGVGGMMAGAGGGSFGAAAPAAFPTFAPGMVPHAARIGA